MPKQAIHYTGRYLAAGARVLRHYPDGSSDPLPLRLDVRNHSPTGFAWGYGGSGPAQLALALLLDVLGGDHEDLSPHYYQDFKERQIAKLDGDAWVLTREEILDWLIDAATGDLKGIPVLRLMEATDAQDPLLRPAPLWQVSQGRRPGQRDHRRVCRGRLRSDRPAAPRGGPETVK